MKPMIKVEEFKYVAQKIHVEKLRAFVNLYMKDDGDTAETSQRMCILNHLSAVEQTINGVVQSDLKVLTNRPKSAKVSST